MRKLEYRADIDGLRALAVLAVIIFHINPEWMPNGFLGVDVFFVISGFLITRILYEAGSRGIWSLSDFYAKRIRRILPVFFVVVLLSLALAYWLFLPNDALAVGKSAIAAIFLLPISITHAIAIILMQVQRSSLFYTYGRSRLRSSSTLSSLPCSSGCWLLGVDLGLELSESHAPSF